MNDHHVFRQRITGSHCVKNTGGFAMSRWFIILIAILIFVPKYEICYCKEDCPRHSSQSVDEHFKRWVPISIDWLIGLRLKIPVINIPVMSGLLPVRQREWEGKEEWNRLKCHPYLPQVKQSSSCQQANLPESCHRECTTLPPRWSFCWVSDWTAFLWAVWSETILWKRVVRYACVVARYNQVGYSIVWPTFSALVIC